MRLAHAVNVLIRGCSGSICGTEHGCAILCRMHKNFHDIEQYYPNQEGPRWGLLPSCMFAYRKQIHCIPLSPLQCPCRSWGGGTPAG